MTLKHYDLPADFSPQQRAAMVAAQTRAIGDAPGVYGECTLYDGTCKDNNLLSALVDRSAMDPWLALHPPVPSTLFKQDIRLITHARNRTDDSPYSQDICGVDAPYREIAICEIECKKPNAIVRQAGPERDDADEGMRNCAYFPRFTIDGQEITSNYAWDAQMMGEGLTDSWEDLSLYGDEANAGEWNGYITLLEEFAANATGNCAALVPNIMDWAGLPMDDTTTAKDWNGTVIPATENLYAVLKRVMKRTRRLLRRANGVNGTPFIAMFVSEFMADCLLDMYICHRYCGGDWVTADKFRLEEFRQQVQDRSAWYFDMKIDGFTVPVIISDLIDDNDILIETIRVGSQLMYGHYARDFSNMKRKGNGNHMTFENGMILGQEVSGDNVRCYNQLLEAEPWMCIRGYQFQTLIKNVLCELSYEPPAITPTMATC